MTKKPPRKSDLVAFKSNQIIYLGDCQVKHWDELTPNQLKIAMYSAAKVQQEDTAETQYTMTFREFADLCKFDEDSSGGANYEKVYREAKKLARSGVDFVTKEGDTVIFNWLDRVTVSPRSGTVTYSLDPRLLPFYKTQRGTFAIVNLLDYMPLRGKYSLLLHEFLAKWQSKGCIYQSIEQLREQLRVPQNKYKRTVDFMRRVVDGAVDEINEKAEHAFRVRIEEKRGVRDAVEGITFYIDHIRKSKNTDADESAALLRSCGVSEQVAADYASQYSLARIRANVELAKAKATNGQAKQLPAIALAAVADDYAEVEQISLLTAEREAEKAAAEEAAAKREAAQRAALEAEALAACEPIQNPDIIAAIERAKQAAKK